MLVVWSLIAFLWLVLCTPRILYRLDCSDVLRLSWKRKVKPVIWSLLKTLQKLPQMLEWIDEAAELFRIRIWKERVRPIGLTIFQSIWNTSNFFWLRIIFIFQDRALSERLQPHWIWKLRLRTRMEISGILHQLSLAWQSYSCSAWQSPN